jgi:hypothetical protein
VGRRELVSAVSGVAVAVPVALIADWSLGVVAGGIAGPLVAMAVPAPVASGWPPAADEMPLAPGDAGSAGLP